MYFKHEWGDLKEQLTFFLKELVQTMRLLMQAKLYPEYGFEKHKGYLTKVHLDALKKHGPCLIHRLTYKPVKDSIK